MVDGGIVLIKFPGGFRGLETVSLGLVVFHVFTIDFWTSIFMSFYRFWNHFGHQFSSILASFLHSFSDVSFVLFFH